MAKQEGVPGKVQNQGSGKYKIDKGDQPNEVSVDLDLPVNGNYAVEKLRAHAGGPNGLPAKIDTHTIRWFNNFSIKENGNYIKKKYIVRIDNLKEKLGNGKLVIYSENHDPKLYYYDESKIMGDTFELDDGDPGTGGAP
jgi:hypothetical protein